MFQHLRMAKAKEVCAQINTRYAGNEALTSHDAYGYNHGNFCKGTHKAHRVAWALYYGGWPTGHIDHINGVRNDNRIINLRSVSMQENSKNMKIPSRNTSGVIGVYYNKECGKWVAQINIDKKMVWLGFFETKLAAINARKESETKNGYHKNHGRKPPRAAL